MAEPRQLRRDDELAALGDLASVTLPVRTPAAETYLRIPEGNPATSFGPCVPRSSALGSASSWSAITITSQVTQISESRLKSSRSAANPPALSLSDRVC